VLWLDGIRSSAALSGCGMWLAPSGASDPHTAEAAGGNRPWSGYADFGGERFDLAYAG